MTGCRSEKAVSPAGSTDFGICEEGTTISGKYTDTTDSVKDSDPADDSGTDMEHKQEPESETPFSVEEKVVCMYPGDSWTIPFQSRKKGTKISPASLRWTSSNPDTVSVDQEGNLTALQEGNAVITCKNLSTSQTICVNVYDQFGGSDYWDLDVLTKPSLLRTYRNYDQGAFRYGDYSEYVWMHGCAACCTATTIGAWYPGEEWGPEEVISQLEPKANEKAWERNYAKPMSRQMPLTLKGISRVLDTKDIPYVYVTSFNKKKVADDLTAHLKKGYPIIYEAGNGGYHMMMLLGIMTDGDVILSDSVGFDRVGVVPLDLVIRQMFSSKEEPEASYFSGRKTAGGYIKVGAVSEEGDD